MSIKKKITRIRKLSFQRRWDINMNAVAVVCAALIIHYFGSTVCFCIVIHFKCFVSLIRHAQCTLSSVVFLNIKWLCHVYCKVQQNNLQMNWTKTVTLSRERVDWFDFVMHTKTKRKRKHHKEFVKMNTQNVLNF